MFKNYLLIPVFIFTLFFLSACSQVETEEEEINNNNLNFMEEQTNQENFPFPADHQDLYSQGYSKALIKTNYGNIKVLLYGKESLNTVNNFLNLANLGFYNNTKFHRVIADFMIQGGDPNTKTDQTNIYGTGGPGYMFADEINNYPLVRGSLAMANSGPNTNGSQFFIVTASSTPWLDGAHTNFGEVIEGMEVVDQIEAVETGVNDLPLEDVIILEIEIIND